ncbi:MAG: electron transport complex subunit RsxC [Clostridia bacterium]
MSRTFRHGTHPSANKFTKDCAITDFKIPETLFISLSQHIGAPAKAVVAVGDYVKEGQLIGEAASFVSANVFSSVSGTVKGIVKLPTATGGTAEHIEIANDFVYNKVTLPVLKNPSKDEILKRVKDAGIVGMGGATFPTHVKFSPSKPIDTVIINAAECEPYITCDYRLLLDRTEDFLRGVGYIITALGVDKAYIGIEANKPDAIKKLVEIAPPNILVMKLRTKYPQGAEKQLIYSVTHRMVPTGGLPMDVGCVVSNVHTAYSIAKAMDGEPLYKRVMTVSGGGVEKTGNFEVRGGTPYQFIYDECRGSKDEDVTKKVLSGGPMMGFALASLAPTCAKGTSSLLFLTKKQFCQGEQTQCINCGKCLQGCPMSLVPRDIERATVNGDYEKAFKLGVLNCIECGVCSYSCPAKRPLVQAMKLAKKEIKTRGIK